MGKAPDNRKKKKKGSKQMSPNPHLLPVAADKLPPLPRVQPGHEAGAAVPRQHLFDHGAGTTAIEHSRRQARVSGGEPSALRNIGRAIGWVLVGAVAVGPTAATPATTAAIIIIAQALRKFCFLVLVFLGQRGGGSGGGGGGRISPLLAVAFLLRRRKLLVNAVDCDL